MNIALLFTKNPVIKEAAPAIDKIGAKVQVIAPHPAKAAPPIPKDAEIAPIIVDIFPFFFFIFVVFLFYFYLSY